MVPGKKTLSIPSMTCGHCTASVKKALESVEGVFDAEVTLDPKQAVVTYDTSTVPEHALAAAVEGAGFEVA